MEFLVDVSLTGALRVRANDVQDLVDKLRSLDALDAATVLVDDVVLSEVSLGLVRPHIAVVAEMLDDNGEQLPLPEQPVLDGQLTEYMLLPEDVVKNSR